MSRKLLAGAAAAAAILAVAGWGLLAGGFAHELRAWFAFGEQESKFGRALRDAPANDVAASGVATADLASLQHDLRAALGAAGAMTIEQGAAWKRRLHNDAATLARFWSPAARCVTAGDCLPKPRDTASCEDLSVQMGQVAEAGDTLAKLAPLLWTGLGGPGLAVPDLHPMQAVLEEGCERVPAIASALALARQASAEQRMAAARDAWKAIRVKPSLEAVRRYAAVYGDAGGGESAEVDALLHTMEERQRLVNNKAFCSTLVKALDSRPDDRKLVLALTKAEARPAYCVTERGSATCGWPDFLDRLADSYPSGASLRADALIEAMQSCAPAQGEITRESYENPDNPGCPAEQRMYASAGIRINAVVSHCHYAQVRVSKQKPS